MPGRRDDLDAVPATTLSNTVALTATPVLVVPSARMPTELFSNLTRLMEALTEPVPVGLITIPPEAPTPTVPLEGSQHQRPLRPRSPTTCPPSPAVSPPALHYEAPLEPLEP